VTIVQFIQYVVLSVIFSMIVVFLQEGIWTNNFEMSWLLVLISASLYVSFSIPFALASFHMTSHVGIFYASAFLMLSMLTALMFLKISLLDNSSEKFMGDWLVLNGKITKAGFIAYLVNYGVLSIAMTCSFAISIKLKLLSERS
jgi:uncharacterized membrane protein YqaE (UPF0057 family)